MVISRTTDRAPVAASFRSRGPSPIGISLTAYRRIANPALLPRSPRTYSNRTSGLKVVATSVQARTAAAMVNASARPAFVKKLSRLAIVLSVVVSSSAPTKQAIPRASKALGVLFWRRMVFNLWNSSEVSGLSPSLMNSIAKSLHALSDSSSPPRFMETRHSFSATDVAESKGRVSEYGRRVFSNSSKAPMRMKPLLSTSCSSTSDSADESPWFRA
mmetsp:Transcript_1078/g.1725  ORF Transcript_1078/g.1725 Transcript_1078/m.1725 type:complete len:216 (-) Transcript_1078:199-846(-)